jgi:hypothetical protein
VAEHGQFFLDFLVERHLGATDDNVWTNPETTEFADRVLGRLSLLLVVGGLRDQADVETQEAVAAGAFPDSELKLPECLDERHALNVTHSAPELWEWGRINKSVSIPG